MNKFARIDKSTKSTSFADTYIFKIGSFEILFCEEWQVNQVNEQLRHTYLRIEYRYELFGENQITIQVN